MDPQSAPNLKQWSRKKSWAFVIGSLLGPAFLAGIIGGQPSTADPQSNEPVPPATSTEESAVTQEESASFPAAPAVPDSEPVIETREETATEKIAFDTTEKNDSSLAKGETQVQQSGREGEKEIRYSVTYTDGVATSREKIAETTIAAPVDKIVLVGTKEAAPAVIDTPAACGADYYRNVDGNCVHRPSSSPAGATAKCRDGTYSYSQNRRGTCSGHGGVAQWL